MTDKRHRRALIRRGFRDIRRTLFRISLFQELTMATMKELDAQIAALSQFVEADEKADDENEAALQAIIVDLKAQQNPDVQPQIDAIQAVVAKLHTPAPIQT